MYNKVYKKVVVTVLLILVFVVLTGFKYLQQDVPDLTDLDAVLIWLATAGGSSIAVAALLSLFVEQAEWWHKLPRFYKVTLPIVVSALLSVGANYLIEYQMDLVLILEPWYKIIMIAVLSYLGTQFTYMVASTANYASKVKESAYAKG